MRTDERDEIRRAALAVLDAHSGDIGVTPDGSSKPCDCPDCERAWKWLRRASTKAETP